MFESNCRNTFLCSVLKGEKMRLWIRGLITDPDPAVQTGSGSGCSDRIRSSTFYHRAVKQYFLLFIISPKIVTFISRDMGFLFL